jgi:hypothetical protein
MFRRSHKRHPEVAGSIDAPARHAEVPAGGGPRSTCGPSQDDERPSKDGALPPFEARFRAHLRVTTDMEVDR